VKNQNNSLSRWISLLYRYSHIYIGRQLSNYDISNGQYIFLNALYKQDGISQEEISDYLKIDKGTTAKVIMQLEKEAYIIRRVDETDKRSKKVFLTEKGLKIKPIVRKTLENWTDALWIGFTEDEKKLTLKMIERIANNAVKFIDKNETLYEEIT
jgi:DNA-binding MarR family transcriptional regulator